MLESVGPAGKARKTVVTAIVPRRLSARESDEYLIALANEIAAGEYDDMLDQMGREAEANLPPGYRFDWEKGEVVRTDPAPADQPIPIDRPQTKRPAQDDP